MKSKLVIGAVLFTACGIVPTSSQAQSELSVLISRCAKGNMAACNMANQVAIAQRRANPGGRYGGNYGGGMDGMNAGIAAQNRGYNNVYRHQRVYGY